MVNNFEQGCLRAGLRSHFIETNVCEHSSAPVHRQFKSKQDWSSGAHRYRKSSPWFLRAHGRWGSRRQAFESGRRRPVSTPPTAPSLSLRLSPALFHTFLRGVQNAQLSSPPPPSRYFAQFATEWNFIKIAMWLLFFWQNANDQLAIWLSVFYGLRRVKNGRPGRQQHNPWHDCRIFPRNWLQQYGRGNF